MTAPKVSVIVPAYNVMPYIGDTLASVVAQTLEEWECIVVDDGSTDATRERAAAFAGPRLRVIAQANAGVSSARNTGFAASRGDTVLFLDGDDVLHPTALARLHAHLAARPQEVACFGAMLRITPSGVIEPGHTPVERIEYDSGDILESVIVHRRTFANGGQLLIRRTAVEQSGGYVPALRLNEDWEFWCRIAGLGPIGYIGSQAEVLRLRVHPDSAATRLSPSWDNHQAAIEHVLSNPTLAARFPPRRWQALKRATYAANMFEAGRQNFRLRNFALARSLMLRSLRLHPTRRTAAIFLLAQASQLIGRPLIGRLRFKDRDA
jgi:glycosyltransferase involved in cell wall biosynthesis